MNTQRFARFFVIAVLIVLIIAPFASVQAKGGPYIETIPLDEVTVIPAGELCPFDVTSNITGVLRVKYWADKDGNLQRELDKYNEKWTYTANGVTLKANNGGPSHITFLSDTEMILRYAGAYTLVTLQGPIFGSAGQGWERYEVVDGEWVKVDEGFKGGVYAWDPEAFCAAFVQ